MTIDEMLAQARTALHRLDARDAERAMRQGSVLVHVRTSEQRDRDGVVPVPCRSR